MGEPQPNRVNACVGGTGKAAKEHVAAPFGSSARVGWGVLHNVFSLVVHGSCVSLRTNRDPTGRDTRGALQPQ